MVRSILLVLFCLAPIIYGQAQQLSAPADEFEYDSEYTYGINFNTNGGLIGGVAGKYAWRTKRPNQFHNVALDIVLVKSNKEVHRQGAAGSNSFIPYKMNYFFSLRPQYGREFILFRKASEDGVHLNAIFAAGPSIGVLKPYYILLNTTQPNDFDNAQSVAYTPALRSQLNGVLGTGSFFDGFSKLSVVPGAHAKAALSFEFGTMNSNVVGIQAGFIAEKFNRNVPIMDIAPNKSFFTTGFVTFYYGVKN